MVRFLKYIFLIFGGLGTGIMCFFFIQNKNDLMAAYKFRTEMNYEGLVKNCTGIKDRFLADCFVNKFDNYLQNVSLTGTSIGMKIGFNVLEEDKRKTTKFTNEDIKNVEYALYYLKLNNMAINNSYKRFFGLDFTYGGFVGKIKEFSEQAKDFSEGIIIGLKGDEGILKIKDQTVREIYFAKLQTTEEHFKTQILELNEWLAFEIKTLEEKYK